jgi:hypothetical protein
LTSESLDRGRGPPLQGRIAVKRQINTPVNRTCLRRPVGTLDGLSLGEQ